MDDIISRQAAIDAMDTWDKFGCDPDGKLVWYDDDKHYVPYVHYDDMVHAIKSLPSAQPEYEELTPEEAASEIASGSITSAWYWLDAMIQLKQMGYAICRKR